jgi:hypothetical protein
MIIRKIDGQNDWTFGKGKSDYATDEAAIEQNIKTRLLSWVNDCFFALPEGVDWKGRLDAGQQSDLLEEVKSIIMQSFGVIGLLSVVANFNGQHRLDTITYTIQTIFSSSFQGLVTFTFGNANA